MEKYEHYMREFAGCRKQWPEWMNGQIAELVSDLFDTNHFELAVKIADLMVRAYGNFDEKNAVAEAQERYLARRQKAVEWLISHGVHVDVAEQAVNTMGMMFEED
jgi:hypothetical protein